MDVKNITAINFLSNIESKCLNDEIINSSYFIPSNFELNTTESVTNNNTYTKNPSWQKYFNNYFHKCTE